MTILQRLLKERLAESRIDVRQLSDAELIAIAGGPCDGKLSHLSDAELNAIIDGTASAEILQKLRRA